MLNFENATINDLSRILKLDQLIFTTPPENKKVHQDRLTVNPAGCFIIKLNEKDIGYIESEIWNDFHQPKENIPASKFHNSKGKILYLSNMGLLPDLRGRGGGSEVLQFLVKLAKKYNLKFIFLKTRNAKTFYEKNDFKLVKHVKLKNYSYDIMKLTLS